MFFLFVVARNDGRNKKLVLTIQYSKNHMKKLLICLNFTFQAKKQSQSPF
jgi:hypothetical protein